MPMCRECKDVFGVGQLNANGLCPTCSSPEVIQERKKKFAKEQLELERKLNLEALNKAGLERKLDNFFITTENVIDIPIEERIEVIFSEYVYGLNIVKDFFASIRDIVGGRVASIEKPLHDTNIKIIEEMKMKAITLGGDAVIGLSLSYQTGGGFISVIGIGTVVKLKKINSQ